VRTADTIEAKQERPESSGKTPKGLTPGKIKRLQNLIAPWTSETAPRNAGRPKKDMSQIIARQVFENNPELLYKAYVKALAKGQAFAFQVLSDRAYGKLKEIKEVTGSNGGPIEFREQNESDLNARIAQLERDLGLATAIDDAGRIGSAAAGAGPTNGKAQDHDLLPR
jgi:hypothetical protein